MRLPFMLYRARERGRVALCHSARRKSRVPLIDHDRNDDRAADHDPLVVLVEVQCTNRLANEHDEQCAQRRADGASLPADETRTTDDCCGDDVKLVALAVTGRCGAVEARSEKCSDACRETRDREYADLDAIERQTRVTARLEATAKREDVTP